MKYEKKNGWTKVSEEEKKDIFKFCEGYKSFLNKGKTERECINYAIIKAEANGFKNLNDVNILKPGDKVYAVNKNKSILLAVIGKKSMAEGVHMVGAHVDCPRIDLKQNPLYEDGEVAYFKTHYYGGIKKYQWTAIPLALHGVICKSDGTQIGIAIGDEGDDVTFTITDLLPHLGGEQMNKPAHSFIEGENLNIVVGSIPLKDEEKEPIKTAILKLLNQKYGIVEEDFVSAEIEVVPAFKAKDVGFDRGLIGAYGQDDRVCAYTALEAILNVKSPEHTAVCYLVDKEEVGSMGNTGAKSHFYEDTIAEMIAKSEDYSDLLVRRCMQNSKCLSADVTAAFDSAYASVSEKRNTSMLSYGVAMSKYTGSRGKSGSNDASAEFVAEIRNIFNENNVIWQTSELGKVDAGGGGTIAQFVANLGHETLDCGTPVLSMHAPFELTSKLDVYMTYKGYLAFFK